MNLSVLGSVSKHLLLDETVEALKALLSPPLTRTCSRTEAFNDILQQSIERFGQLLQEKLMSVQAAMVQSDRPLLLTNCPAEWQFTSLCLRLLRLVGCMLANDSGHSMESSDHTAENSGHTGENNGHTVVISGHTGENTDHTGENSGHTVVNSDHTGENTDHTGENSGHTVVNSDHTGENSDHTGENNGHTVVISGHTQENSDHTGENSDHTWENSDHTRENSDHTGENSDHTGENTEYTHGVVAGSSDPSNSSSHLGPRAEASLAREALPLDDLALSLSQIDVVRKALQFVVCLGVCPNLLPGVGIPVQYRSQQLLQAPQQTLLHEISQCCGEKNQRLASCLSVLVGLLQVPALETIVLGAHLSDILAAAMQLAFVRREDQRGSDKTSLMTEQGHEGRDEKLSDEQVQLGNHTLQGLVTSVSHDRLIQELLVLTSGVPKAVQLKRSQSKDVVSPPAWLRGSCDALLMKLVKGPQGILNLYTAISRGGPELNTASEWKFCDVVAKVIGRCPVPAADRIQYVLCVSQQLLGMLATKGKDEGRMCRLVGAVASEMIAKYPELFQQHFHRALLEPLIGCTLAGPVGVEAVAERDLTDCLQRLDKIYIQEQQPQSVILSELLPILEVLWCLFACTRSSVYSIKRCVRELLLTSLRSVSSKEAAQCLQQLCVRQMNIELAVKLTSPLTSPLTVTVCFEAAAGGGVRAVFADASCTDSGPRMLEQTDQVDAVIDILQDLKQDGVAGDLLVILLQELTEMINSEKQAVGVVLPSAFQSVDREKKRSDLRQRVTLLHVMSSICETFGSECFTDRTQILLFAKASLEKGVAVCSGTSEEALAMFETEMMSMALGLLTAVMAGGVKVEDRHQELLDELLPLLRLIAEGYPDEFIQEMASDIRIAIATRGAVWSSLQENKPEKEDNAQFVQPEKKAGKRQLSPKPPTLTLKPLIEVLPDKPPADAACSPPRHTPPCRQGLGWDKDTVSKTTASMVEVGNTSAGGMEVNDRADEWQAGISRDQHQGEAAASELSHNAEIGSGLGCSRSSSDAVIETGPKSALQEAFKELCDPLLPVRGHALIMLNRLLQAGDTQALSKHDVLRRVFEENLRHGDSYLYLAAINGLSTLADHFPESLIPSLAAQYAGWSRDESDLSCDQRLKLGEVLMKAIKNLGEAIPKYRDVLLGAVLCGARDKDAAVRASSVSNLAQVCALLRFSLGSVIYEVLECCSRLLERDETIVRQAAALTLAKILEGLDKDAITVLDSSMKQIYHLLKKVHEADPDPSVRLHANMALVTLDTTARNFLFPAQRLEKHIQVLTDEDTFR